ncbi:MAG: S41 family peptidase [Verrucomicrobiia bacterium]|jgi:carboxyl-terminal processing protease
MKRKLTFAILIIVLGINLIIGARIYFYSLQAVEKDDPYTNLKIFTTVLERIKRDYVDGDKLSYHDLIYGALKGMLGMLDPHSEFMDSSKYEELRKDTEGAFGGVGIVVSVKDNYITVVSPMEDTPGFKAGILPGDRIIKIDGRSTEKMSLQEAVKRLRGKPGTDVTLTISRPTTGEVKDYKLTRAEIKVPTIKDINGKNEFPVGEDRIGYVRITQFGEQTADDLEAALKKLESKNIESLIIDLRNNPGGLLDQAVAVCEKFLPRGTLVVSTEGQSANQKAEYRAGGRGKHREYPLVVLVNNGSASASEIVAGCLQDLKRAIIVGEQTFGKGSVQSIIPLQDGSALRLTTAKYYTPSHRVIHERGITPDITVTISEEQERDLFLKRNLISPESLDEKEQQRLKDVRDTQLERAIDLLKGIQLFSKRTNKSVKVAGKSDN